MSNFLTSSFNCHTTIDGIFHWAQGGIYRSTDNGNGRKQRWFVDELKISEFFSENDESLSYSRFDPRLCGIVADCSAKGHKKIWL
jgi:hypothetical protein